MKEQLGGNQKIYVDHVVAGLHPGYGGTSRVVVQLSDALSMDREVVVRLISQARFGEKICPSSSEYVQRDIGIWQSSVVGRLGLAGAACLRNGREARRTDLLHSHGIWHPINYWCARLARKYRIPLVVQPHGMLEPWALAWRGWKKRFALCAYQRRDLESASVLFATAEQEAEGLRSLGLRQPIAVIPNGVELSLGAMPVVHGKVVPSSGPRKVLFLSRIHPKKGLLNLLDAWAALDSQDWLLQLAGPDEDGHLVEVRQRISELGLENRVQYLGSIDDAKKGSVYEAADLFILPSFSENFGVVVAEALSYALPVITTRGTPWQGLEQHGCGWWVEPSVDGLVGAMRDALAKEPAQLREMGRQGQVYVREFDWLKIASQTIDVYRWIIGHGDRPSSVNLA